MISKFYFKRFLFSENPKITLSISFYFKLPIMTSLQLPATTPVKGYSLSNIYHLQLTKGPLMTSLGRHLTFPFPKLHKNIFP